METYTFLRGFADSWMLVALVVFFVGVVIWVYRPGARKVHDDIAKSIFDNEDKPKDSGPEESRRDGSD